MSRHDGIGQEISPISLAPSREVVCQLLQTADSIRRYYNRMADTEGLTLQQYNVLRILREAGKDGLPTMAICERMVEQTPGLTRIIDRLELAGLVSRTRHISDRRKVVCTLTLAARKLLERLDSTMKAADLEVFSSLDASQLTLLSGLLQQIHRTTEGR